MERQPIGPTPARADVLGRLRRERWFAADAGETARVAQIDRQIAQLSAAGTATAPTRETTAAADRPAQSTTARTTKPKPTKRNRNVSAR